MEKHEMEKREDKLNIDNKNKLKNRVYKPKAGFGINPMLKYPRNYPCFCNSGIKFKKCCYGKLARYIKQDAVQYYSDKINNFMKKVKIYESNKKGKLKTYEKEGAKRYFNKSIIPESPQRVEMPRGKE